jgi:hypothetical protein
MRTRHIAPLLSLLFLVPASPAAAASWESSGSVKVSSKPIDLASDVVDRRGVYSALAVPIIREGGSEVDGPAVLGDVVEIVREPGKKPVRRAGFNAHNGLIVATRDGGRIAASIGGTEGNERVEVRRRTARGKWSAAQIVADGQKDVQYLDIDLAPNGAAIVSWTNVHDSSPQYDSELIAAAQPAGGKRFGAAQAVSRGNFQEPKLEIDDSGNALAAWIDREARVLQTARFAGGAWTAPAATTVPGFSVAGPSRTFIAVDGSGRALVAWTLSPEGAEFPPALVVAEASTGAPLGAPRVVSGNVSSEPELDSDGGVLAATWTHGSATMVQGIVLGKGDDLANATIETLSPQGDAVSSPDVVVADGRATFAWSRRTVVSPARTIAETRSIDPSGKLGGRQEFVSSKASVGNAGLTASSTGDPWLVLTTRRGNTSTMSAARASARTGKFARARTITGNNSTRLLPGRRGTMLSSIVKKNTLQVLVYGE